MSAWYWIMGALIAGYLTFEAVRAYRRRRRR
jgi:hypothetical protein